MSIPDRMYKAAKGYLDNALARWDEIDERAQRELDSSLGSPALSAWERAQAKIQATQAQNAAARGLAADREALAPTPPVTSTSGLPSSATALEAAYKVLGVAVGSDYLTVQTAYQELKTRTAPDRFPEGSPEQTAARDIERRVNAAYMVLANVLRPASDDRFDRLEL